MTDVPEGARLSDDGQWWWDESAQQWQPVQGAASASGSSGTGGSDAQGGEGSGGDGGASSGGGDGGQAAARVAAGLPAALTEITDDQRAAYIGEAQVSAEPEELETVETLAMNDSGENGEAMA